MFHLAHALLNRRVHDTAELGVGFLAFLVVASFVAYLWWLIMIPTHTGDTIKATYLLHVFPLEAVLGAEFLRMLRVAVPYVFGVVAGALVFVAFHNGTAFITRY